MNTAWILSLVIYSGGHGTLDSVMSTSQSAILYPSYSKCETARKRLEQAFSIKRRTAVGICTESGVMRYLEGSTQEK